MERTTLENRLLELKRRRPFNPFFIVTTTGQRVEVATASSVGWGPNQFAVGLANSTFFRFQPEDVSAIEAPAEEQ